MSEPVRLAGRGRWRDSLVTWTIAEGRRGRRWREVLTRDGRIVHALLLETDPAGRFSHLELAVAAVLLTLHPEGDGTLHGNRVAADGAGVEPIAGLPFPAGAAVLVDGSPIAAAAMAWGGAGEALGALVDAAGRVTIGTVAPPADLSVDAEGIPRLADTAVWPLDEG
jgi:hypothetical protein